MSEDLRGRGLSTRAVHAGSPDRGETDAVTNPIYQSTTFVSDPTGQGPVLYTRYGNNPGQIRVEQKIAELEGAEECLLTSSGMAAMSSALLGALKAGDHLVAAEALYGGTRLFIDRELSRLGIEATYADMQTGGWEGAIRENTRVILGEITTNPLLRVPDLDAISEIAHAHGCVFIVDVTFATPANLRSLEHGVDLAVHSATKYLNGHSDVTAGAVCGSSEHVTPARDRMKIFGSAIDPHAAWLLERGLKTFAVRMAKHNANGVAVAEWAEAHPEISRVHYPGLASHPDHERAKRLLDGFGAMIGLEVEGGPERATALIRALRMVTAAPSLGGVETLVSEPRFTSHAAMSPEQRESVGIRDGFLRVSLGIEDADDIIADFEQALAASRSAVPSTAAR